MVQVTGGEARQYIVVINFSRQNLPWGGGRFPTTCQNDEE